MIALMLALSLAAPPKTQVNNTPPPSWEKLGQNLDDAIERVGRQMSVRYGQVDQQLAENTDSICILYYTVEGENRTHAHGEYRPLSYHRIVLIRYPGGWYATPERIVRSLPFEVE